MERLGQVFRDEDRKNIINKDSSDGWSSYGFSRDLSRIIFSNSYKRLAGKTQVFPVGLKDHLMTRLTHTLFVENIALDIAIRVNSMNDGIGINLELVQAIANGHDIGHTPFGHVGERTLKSIVKEYLVDNSKYTFKHNIFSVDVLQNIDKVRVNEYGYDLSWQVIDGILKHTGIQDPHIYNDYLKHVCNNNNFNKKSLSKIVEELIDSDKNINSDTKNYFSYPFPLTIEGQIVKLADEIAQYYHDVLDWSRIFNFTETMNDLFNKILSIDNRIYSKNDHILKFINTFSKNGKLTKDKLIEDNREFFLKELKDLFITDAVAEISCNIKKDFPLVILDDGTKIIKNIIFEIDPSNYKVVPKFSKQANEIAQVIVNAGKIKIAETKIKKADEEGENKIKSTFKLLYDDIKLYEQLCFHDLVHKIELFLKKKQYEVEKVEFGNHSLPFTSFLSREINNDIINFLKKESSLLIYFQTSNHKKEDVTSELKSFYISTIVESIGRMTDSYLNNLFSTHKKKFKNLPS